MIKMISNYKLLRIVLLISVFFIETSVVNAQNGEELFQRICKVCHTIGSGRLVGPDLKGVTQKRSEEWLMIYVKSSQSLIKSGDVDAIAIFEEYGKIPMPDPNISDPEIKAILNYIKKTSSDSLGNSEMQNSIVRLKGNIESGRDLFIGVNLLEAGGPACISCHKVNDEAAYYGGNFSKDLTDSYGVLQEAGTYAVIENLSFPAMMQTYNNKRLLETEISDLVAYLKYNSENETESISMNFSAEFLLYGLAVCASLILFMYIFWSNKKPDSVKKHIYERSV